MHGTTILAVRKDKEFVIAADGQITLGYTVVKSTANKIRKIANGQILAGFAGSTADALTLFERLESKLEKYSYNLLRSCVELAKDWRTDKYLRRLEAMLIVADKNQTFILSGNGDIIEPENKVVAIGSGGNYAESAARALIEFTELTAEDVARKAMKIASDICVFTNNNLTLEKIVRTNIEDKQ